MLMSPSTYRLEELPRKCQLRLLDDLEVLDSKQKNFLAANSFAVGRHSRDVLASLDGTDLKILEVVEGSSSDDGVTTREIAESVFLSPKAVLHRARKLVAKNLIEGHSTRISKGDIQPASVFSPVSCSNLTAQKSVAIAKEAAPVNTHSLEKNGKAPYLDFIGLDVISLIILGVIGCGIAFCAEDIYPMLGYTQSPIRKRLKDLKDKGYLISETTHPYVKRPGVKKLHYSLSANLTKEDVWQAVQNIELSKLPKSLDPGVDWARIGITSYTAALNTNQPEPLADKSSNILSSTDTQTSVQVDEKTGPNALWNLLEAMAAKIAEYEKRISELEARNSNDFQQKSREILAILPPRHQ